MQGWAPKVRRSFETQIDKNFGGISQDFGWNIPERPKSLRMKCSIFLALSEAQKKNKQKRRATARGQNRFSTF